MYDDRRHAGRLLGEALLAQGTAPDMIVGIPRGGVAVAAEVRRVTGGDLDVVIGRKLGAPGNPEFAIGAVAEGGVTVVDPRLAARMGLDEDALSSAVALAAAQVASRVQLFRGGKALVVEGRSVVLVDDGLATGSTFLAAFRALASQEPGQLVGAVPVAPADTLAQMRAEGAEVVCPLVPRRFRAVGEFYKVFTQVTDREVLEMLGP